MVAILKKTVDFFLFFYLFIQLLNLIQAAQQHKS